MKPDACKYLRSCGSELQRLCAFLGLPSTHFSQWHGLDDSSMSHRHGSGLYSSDSHPFCAFSSSWTRTQSAPLASSTSKDPVDALYTIACRTLRASAKLWAKNAPGPPRWDPPDGDAETVAVAVYREAGVVAKKGHSLRGGELLCLGIAESCSNTVCATSWTARRATVRSSTWAGEKDDAWVTI